MMSDPAPSQTSLWRLPGVGLLVGAAFVSNVGNWIQIFTEQWALLHLAGNEAARWAGRLSFSMGIAILVLSPFGGTLADRWPRRTLVALAQGWLMATALALGLLSLTPGGLTLSRLVGFAAVSGLGVALSAPVFYTLVADVVPPARLPGTYALMSAQWNLSRVLGPGIAAALMPLVGVAGNFLLNAASFLLLIFVVLRLRTTQARPHHAQEGRYRELPAVLRRTPLLASVVALAALVGAFGWCYAPFLPLYGTRYLHFGEHGVAALFSVFGAGALAGAFWMARENHTSLPLRLLTAFAVYGSAMLLLGALPHVTTSLLALAVMGFCQATFLTCMGSLIQLRAPEHLRGRMYALYVVGIMGLAPLGDLVSGEVAQRLGWHGPRLVEAAVGGLMILAAFLARKPLLSEAPESAHPAMEATS